MKPKSLPYIPGDYKVACDRCGFVFLRSQCRYEPTTLSQRNKRLLVCKQCYDPPHPQDRTIYGLGERQYIRDPHPEPEMVFVTKRITPDDL